MARIRTIKPEFFASESVSELPLRARLTWIGLWTHCDNYGRTRDNAKLIKAAVWPLDAVSLRDIEEDLTTLAEHGRIVRYAVGGKRYLAVANWSEHQYGACKGEPKYPGESEGRVLNPDGSLENQDKSRTGLNEYETGLDQSKTGLDQSGRATTPDPAGDRSENTELPASPAQTASINEFRTDINEFRTDINSSKPNQGSGIRDQGSGGGSSRPARPRARPDPGELAATATSHGGTTTVLRWRETTGIALTHRSTRALAKQIDQLLGDGADPNLIPAALDDWATRGKTPAFLPHCYDDQAKQAHAGVRGHPNNTGGQLSKRTQKALAYLTPEDRAALESGRADTGAFGLLEGGGEP